MKTYRYEVTKIVEIEAPNSWTEREMRQLAEDSCCGELSCSDWDLSGVNYSASDAKVTKIKKETPIREETKSDYPSLFTCVCGHRANRKGSLIECSNPKCGHTIKTPKILSSIEKWNIFCESELNHHEI